MDPASFSSFPEWNYLPNEIKAAVIQRMDNNSRLALRACSVDSQKLVDSTPYRMIRKLSVVNKENEWCITISRSVYSNDIKLNFPTFDEFQNRLTKEIEKNDYIQEMEILNEEVINKLNLLKFGKPVRIGKIYLHGERLNSHYILGQIDLNILGKLALWPNPSHPETLHVPQITYKELSITNTDEIRDDSLLTFECSHLYSRNCRMLTARGINNYIRKWLLNLDKNHVSFEIWLIEEDIIPSEIIEGLDIASSVEENLVFINSPFPNLQLKVKYCEGCVRGKTIRNGTLQNDDEKSKTLKDFKVVEFLKIDLSTWEVSKLIIELKDKCQTRYEFESTADMQLKLTEELDKINYIKHLDIGDEEIIWNLTSPSKNQITVGKLSILGGKRLFDYLQQIEPYHLKEIKLDLLNECRNIFDMPQVIHAERLNFYNCNILDEQLLRLNAVSLQIQTERDEGNEGDEEYCCNLTDSGINAFVKKCLPKLDQHDFNFSFYESGDERDSSKFFEGLDVFSEKQIHRFKKETIVNSPFPQYQLELRTNSNSITGKRIEKL